MAKPKLEELRETLRSHGMRATSSRLAVLELLITRAGDQPLSHAEACEALKSGPWDPATIYRNLVDLVEAKLARRSDLGDHVWRFELVKEGGHDVSAHPHFVCTECGTVECLPSAQLSTREKTPRAVKQRKVEVQVRGRCDTCF
ncbi:MAG: transcriptional repressor [Kofleriaceae bacterium]|nr:transcriptional repressor [Kofleriaceae bacterium]